MIKQLKTSLVLTVLSMLLLIIPSAEALSGGADAIIGEWYTENNKSIVKIYKSGNKYYGKIIWLKIPNNSSGTPKKDVNNPDEKKRSRPLLNLLILTGFVYDGDDEWDDGEIYNPEDGETYSCTMTLSDNNTLDVRGYIGISLFGKTTTWKRKS